MDTSDASRRRRHRGRRKRGLGATVATLPPGRAPVGSISAESGPPAINTNEQDSDSDTSATSEQVRLTSFEAGGSFLSIQDKLKRLLLSSDVDTTNLLRPPVTFNPTMSTLGAQARAAEYAAATAARQRQFSREKEAEEQRLPPKSTPVSLCAFTKLSTRNKGNKTWKPLTFDDLGGDDFDDDFTPHDSRHATPVPEEQPAPRSKPRVHLLTRANQGILEDGRIPTAPRAMMNEQGRSFRLANPVPKRIQPHPVINFPPQQLQKVLGQSPMPTATQRGLLSQRKELHRRYLQVLRSLDTPPSNGRTSQRTFGDPNDMTPTRNQLMQNLLHEREIQSYESMRQMIPYGSEPPPVNHGIFDDNPLQYFDSNQQNPYSYGAWPHPIFEPQPPSYLPIEFQSSEQTNMPPSLFEGFNSNKWSSTNSQQATYNDVSHNNIPPPALYHPEYRKPDQLYDRIRNMETCRANLTKEAFERKGKTVLHNPDLHKSDLHSSEEFGSHDSESNGYETSPSRQKFGSMPIPPVIVSTRPAKATEPVQRPQKDVFASDPSEQVTTLISRPPPGLELPVDGGGDDKFEEDNSTGLNIDFPDEFFELRPMTHIERNRIGKAAEKARDDLAATVTRPVHTTLNDDDINQARQEYSNHWFHSLPPFEDFSHRNAMTARFERASMRLDLSEDSEGSDESIDRFMMDDVIGTIRYYFDQLKMPVEKRSILHKIKEVPEYATERRSVQTGGSPAFISYFEELDNKADTERAFIPTPLRIARDPRFRPQGKDGAKVKMEDEWKVRHEVYGRRKL